MAEYGGMIQGNVASGGNDVGNPIKTGGVYNSTAPTFTTGQRGDTQIDSSGNTLVSDGTIHAGEDLVNNIQVVEQRYSYSNVNSDTAVKSAAGFLHSVTFSCNDAAPTAGTIDIYDNTAGSGTKIFSWTLTTAVFNPTTIILDVSFATGLYIDFTTTADVNVVCSYR